MTGNESEQRMLNTRNILVLHGPNLNLLGSREPQHYGSDTLATINSKLVELGQQRAASVNAFQSNREYELIDRIHAASNDGTDFIIINPAAFTHTSVAIRDALAGVKIPFVEVHLSNVHAREHFRHRSLIAPVARGVILGFGSLSYDLALQGLLAFAGKQKS